MVNLSEPTWPICAHKGGGAAARTGCHVQERLNDLYLENSILLPQVQDSHNLTLQNETAKKKKNSDCASTARQ